MLKESILTLTNKKHFVSRQALIARTGRSVDFVSRTLREMVDEGLLEEESFVTEITRSHPQVAYRRVNAKIKEL